MKAETDCSGNRKERRAGCNHIRVNHEGFLSARRLESQPENERQPASLQMMVKSTRKRGLKTGVFAKIKKLPYANGLNDPNRPTLWTCHQKHHTVTRYSCGYPIHPNLKWELPCNILRFRDQNIDSGRQGAPLPVATTQPVDNGVRSPSHPAPPQPPSSAAPHRTGLPPYRPISRLILSPDRISISKRQQASQSRAGDVSPQSARI